MPRIGSAGVNLPFPGINGSLGSNARSLPAGAKHLLPAGIFLVNLGAYTSLQVFDPVSQIWGSTAPDYDGYIESDGVNFRIANLTGTMVGAVVTNAGTGYTAAPTITPTIGNAQFRAVLGGSVNPVVTVLAAGSGYNHSPQVLLTPPNAGGIQATATAAVANGAITTVTVNNIGGGYTTAPQATIIPDPTDTITSAAAFAVSLLGNSTNLSGILCVDPGTAVTSIPTLNISLAPTGGTTAIASAIPMFTVQSINVASAGSNYGATQPYQVFGAGALTAAVSAVTNPIADVGLFQPLPFSGYGSTLNAGVLVTSGFVISNGGLHQAVPGLAVVAGGTSVPTLYGSLTANVGGVTDTSFLIQIV